MLQLLKRKVTKTMPIRVPMVVLVDRTMELLALKMRLMLVTAKTNPPLLTEAQVTELVNRPHLNRPSRKINQPLR